MVDFPEFEGVTVPANALFSDDGSRGGMVGIAPVSPYRLPGTLPEGLDFPLVITVQTDGATNFDTPAPLCFPNLPDPATGIPLPAGTKSALWSFNHDTGRFEIAGSMTVSADGKLVCTDLGVGVLAPGWHGTQPGCELRGRKPSGKPENQPGCKNATNYNALELVWSITKEVVACGARLLGVCDAYKCGIGVTTAVVDMGFTIKKMVDDSGNEPTFKRTQLSLTAISNLKGIMTSVADCLDKGGNPVNKFLDALNCAQNAVGIADSFCAFVDLDQNQPAQCRPTKRTQDLCVRIKETKFALAMFLKGSDRIKDAFDDFKVAATCALIDAVTLIANDWPKPTNPLQLRDGDDDFDRYLTEEEIAALTPALESIQDELDRLMELAELIDFPLQIERATQMHHDLLELQALTAAAMVENGTPLSKQVYYVVEINGVAQRGSTDASGTFRRNAAADSDYFFAQWDPAANSYGAAQGRTGANGAVTNLPSLPLNDASGLTDTDGDGLADVVEFVLGTDPNNKDSDNDGVNDFAEGSQGTNPLDNVPNGAGLIASADTPGTATDIAAFDDLIAVADGDAGVTIFNVFNGMNPTIVAQVETSGNATAVALSARYAAIADDSQGLAIVDLVDPPAARVTQQVMLGASTISVEIVGGTCFVGLTSGDLVAVDLESGAILEAASFGASVHDIRGVGDALYVLTAAQLFILHLEDLTVFGSVESGGSANSNIGRKRLFVSSDGVAYVTHRRGYDTFDISSSLDPQLITATVTPQFGWKQIVTNGSGTGIAALSPNQAFDGPHNISTYNVSDPALTQAFLAELVTPGVARAISLYNGIAYVADHSAGLQAVRYLEPDRSTVPPTISISTNFAENRAEEGQWMRVSTAVTDDVEVRNVQLFLDDTRIATDGNYPFEFRILTPLISEGAGAIDIRARATDTAGNFTDSLTLTLTLVPDATPPRTTRISPEDGAFRGGADAVIIGFSEAVDPLSVNTGTIRVTNAGPDQIFGTADDSIVNSGKLSLQPDGQTAIVRFNPTLPDAFYRLSVDGVTDLAGNPLEAFATSFEIGELTMVAAKGTPADRFQPSANAGQRVTIASSGFAANDTVTFPTRDQFGSKRSVDLAVENITENGRRAEVVVPLNACTGLITLPGGSPLRLQIVPTITSIDGGPGRSTAIFGTGFIEGATTARFGPDAAVIDRGTSSNDGIDVRNWNSQNDRLDVGIPAGAQLPYQIITEGGSSGRATDVSMVIATASTGTPFDAAEASANIDQMVRLQGVGFAEGETKVTLEAMDQFGTAYIITVDPDTITANGTSLEFTVPKAARSGIAAILNGGSGFPLQVVPTITSISGGRGRFTAIYGGGFVEGATTVRFGSENVLVADSGVTSNDGIDVRDWNSKNDRLDVTAPANANLPYEVITTGGSSGKITNVTDVIASAPTGTPAISSEASAVVGQNVELRGSGLTTGSTMVTLEAMDQFGTPYVTTIAPASVSNDGTSLSFIVPAEARTGVAVILNGAGGKLLQIVPTVGSINGGRGRFTSIYGTGFTEGQSTVRFGSDATTVIDGGVASGDGIDVRNWNSRNDRLDVTVPAGGSSPIRVINEGGTSSSFTP
ncbi:MAG: hypothetical protein ACI9R3_003126 [Verrucomicrobiales bacterium]|jgi:hypothetical protein